MKPMEKIPFSSQFDGTLLEALVVTPDSDKKGVVQFAHGMSEHKERYLPFMQYLAERGCLCVINDHRGHSASVRDPGDLGYFYAQGDLSLVEDMHQITCWMRERFPGRKLFLFGHSMGSLAARAYCAGHDDEIDALVLSGSPGRNPAVGPGLALIALLCMLKGERHRSRLLQGMTVGMFARRFPDPEHPCAWLSANMENVIAYENDPLCSFTFTLNGNRALLRLMRRAYGLKHGRADLPVRFYSGSEDPCAPDEKGFRDAVERMRRAGYSDVQGTMFPGMRHEILNETDREMVFARIWSEAFEPNI